VVAAVDVHGNPMFQVLLWSISEPRVETILARIIPFHSIVIERIFL
jgi:hypothetical protein